MNRLPPKIGLNLGLDVPIRNPTEPGAHFFRTLIKKVVDRQKKFSSFFPACRKPL
jgi:hypothetical protein